MHLCLSCRSISPAGSLLCGRCGRSFGGRLCPRHHVGGLGGSLGSLVCWCLIHLLNLCPYVIMQSAARAVTWLLALLVLSWFLPEAAGAHLRGALLGTLQRAGRTAYRLGWGFGGWVYHRVEGAPTTPEKAGKKKRH